MSASVHCPPLVQGEFGPFNPSMHTQVPLWLALNLRQRHKCRIEPPQWLNVGTFYDQERKRRVKGQHSGSLFFLPFTRHADRKKEGRTGVSCVHQDALTSLHGGSHARTEQVCQPN